MHCVYSDIKLARIKYSLQSKDKRLAKNKMKKEEINFTKNSLDKTVHETTKN